MLVQRKLMSNEKDAHIGQKAEAQSSYAVAELFPHRLCDLCTACHYNLSHMDTHPMGGFLGKTVYPGGL